MKIKKKLRDVTPEEYEKYKQKICTEGDSDYCKECMFRNVRCRIPSLNSTSWVLHKDIYSDRFLDQEIEIEVNNAILTPEEKKYLSAVINLFRGRVKSIQKRSGHGYIVINVAVQEFEFGVIKFLVFDNNKFKEMELNKNYSLEELGL